MWNVEANVIPGITGQRTILELFRQYLDNKAGKHEIMELQKIAILRTAHVLRKLLM